MIHPKERMPSTSTNQLILQENAEGHPQETLIQLVRKRLRKPQRHRLLHGYPLAASMPFLDHDTRQSIGNNSNSCFQHDYQVDKPILVGVLPHSYCNPKIAGCGFCTFPHEDFSSLKATAAVNGVIQEIETRIAATPSLAGKPVDALYFGGATANLTPPDAFRRLCKTLNGNFDLRNAEITLEGVPAFFLNRRPWLLDILQEELAARHFRISLGIQTFSKKWQSKMGRTAFGDGEVFAQIVRIAHSRNMTVSGDLLFNLPGQSLAEMLADVASGSSIGLDQMCLYHLVMFRGLATAWSRDAALIASLPSNETAAANWEVLRSAVSDSGFYQTTLTNFERCSFQGDFRSYIYELRSFETDRYNMIGFGPSGISYSSNNPSCTGLKTMNPESSLEYLQSVGSQSPIWNRYYKFDTVSQRLLYVTRRFSGLSLDRIRYHEVFGTDVMADYQHELAALATMRLIDIDTDVIRPTVRGMFFSDTIASVLASARHAKQYGNESADQISLMGNQNGFM